MNMGGRSFIFEGNGAMRRLSLRLSSDLAVGVATLPEYAGRSLRHAHVKLELDDRKRPARILQIQATIWHFDETGNPQKGLALAAMGALERGLKKPLATPGPESSVVDKTKLFGQKKWEAKYRWVPSEEEIQQIFDSIWPPGRKPGGGRKEYRTRHRPDGLTVVSTPSAGGRELRE